MYKLNVFYEDVDACGVVYYANYLKYLERAHTQILPDNNINHTYLKNEFNIFTVVKSCYIDYIKSAILDDELEIFTSQLNKSRVNLFLSQKIFCKKNLIIEAKLRIVTINIKGIAVRIPEELYNIF